MFKKLNNIIISSLLFCGPCCNMLSAKTADTVISANDDYSNLIALDVVDENVDDEEAAGDWSDDSEGDWSDEWEDDDNGFYTDAPAAPKSQFETNFTSKYNEEDDSEADEFEIDASATQTKKPNNIEASASPAPASETGASSKTTTSTETTTYTQKITEGAGSISELEKQVLKDIEDEKNRQKYASLAKTLKRPEADFIKLYSEYGDVLAGLNPNNPKDLAEIEKLIEIVGVPKRESNLKPSPTLKQARADDPIVNFSARNVPVRDAFATLARVSGMSITVSGQIGDRDLISVVEINNQPFTKAFLSLVEAADVDFSASGNAFTILKRKGQRTTSLSASMDSTDIDLTKALEDRYADLIYDNEDLSSIIKDLANKYGVDVVMTATPTDRITLRVRGVNIEDAFELVFAGSQFGYTRKDDTFIVYSTTNKNFGLDRKTILFPLKYLEAQQAQKLLPAEIKDKVQISETQNAFIASGSKMELTQLYDFIRTIDRPIPQVEFNVQLVEVSRDFSRSVGLLQDQFSLGKIGNLTGGTGLNFGWNSTFNEENTAIFKNRPTYNQSSGTSQIKVNQRLLVTSGKSAKINFDEDRNILLNAGSSTGQNIGVVQQQNIQRITAGNSMDITPVVGGGGVVTVKVEVEVSANNDINNDTGIPRTTVRRRLSSVIQITDNETIAIGGLFDNRKSLGNKNELPLVSRLPVIGQLFTSQGSKNKNLKELIILITPHIKTGEEKEQVYIQAEGGI